MFLHEGVKIVQSGETVRVEHPDTGQRIELSLEHYPAFVELLGALYAAADVAWGDDPDAVVAKYRRA